VKRVRKKENLLPIMSIICLLDRTLFLGSIYTLSKEKISSLLFLKLISLISQVVKVSKRLKDKKFLKLKAKTLTKVSWP